MLIVRYTRLGVSCWFLSLCQCLEKNVALTLARYLEREERLLPPARYDPSHRNTCFLEHGGLDDGVDAATV